MAYTEVFYHTYCNRKGQECRVSFQENDVQPELDIVRRGHFNNVSASEIGVYKEGADFSFLSVGDTIVISGSSSNDGSYTVTDFHNSIPPDDPYIRIELSPQVPVEIDEDDVRIEIFAAARSVEAARPPFFKSIENSSGLKVGGVFPSTATVTFVSEPGFDMERLYTADEKKYLITHYVDGTQDWIGNVIPNGFSEERHGEHRYMVITASDRLSALQGVLFTDNDGTNYGESDGVFRRSFIWDIKEALKKTGYLLPIWTLVDIRPKLTSESETLSTFVIGDSGSGTIKMADTGVSPILQAGTKIYVSWDGASSQHLYTVLSWTTYSQFGGQWVDISVQETPEDIGAPAIIEIDNPPSLAIIDDPLAITEHDVRVWINNADEVGGQNYFEQRETAKTAWEVLYAVARQWNARIYLNSDHWEVIRWNAMDKSDSQYQWFVYNSEGTEIDRVNLDNFISLPCINTDENFEILGSEISMDRVLRRVNVNYRYKYKVDGDSIKNLIQNGNFGTYFTPGVPPPSSDPFTFTPQRWVRGISTLNPSAFAALGIQQILSPNPGEYFPPDISSFIKLNGVYNKYVFLSSDTGYPTSVNEGDTLKISWWQRTTWWRPTGAPSNATSKRYFVCRILLVSENRRYCLVNQSWVGGEIETSWHEVKDNDYPALVTTTDVEPTLSDDNPFPWYKVDITTPGSPIQGRIVIEIVGAATRLVNPSQWGEPDLLPTTILANWPVDGGMAMQERQLSSSEVHLSGFFVGRIINQSSEAIPQIHGYTYPDPQVQRNRDYTDTIEDIEILTGDDQSSDQLSNVLVNGEYINKWDTWTQDYGWTAMGLVLAKSVISQYWVPWRMLDVEFSSDQLQGWSDVMELEDRPGEIYAILRGAIAENENMFSGTLVQVADLNSPVTLPGGGIDGGNTVDPLWKRNGVTRCIRDAIGENTGQVEALEIDVNPASNTYNQQRWVNIGSNEGMCPIGDPVQLYWGEQAVLDVDGLRYYPYEKDIDAYTVTYSNDGGGAYLRLLHLASLGTVQSILYAGNYESISGWVYEADEVINGYTYKHLRLSWLTGVYSDLPVIFVIN